MKKKNYQFIRYLSQAGFVLYLAYMVFGPMLFKSGSRGLEVHSICPFGAMETLPTFLASGGTNFVREASGNNLVMLGALLLSVLAFGAAFCGWACPVGSISEWLYKFRKLFFKKDIKIPIKVHNVLKWFRYVMLGLVLVFSLVTASLWFERFDPFIDIFSFRLFMFPDIILIIVFVVGSMFIERFFCNYVCPLGAVIKPVAALSPTGIVRSDSCVSCGVCHDVCPKRINFNTTASKIDRSECISCMRCVEDCVCSNTLAYQIGW